MTQNWKDKRDFKETVFLYADKINIKVKQIAVRPMKRKWASCSTNGYLNFNIELIGMERLLGEYVILHELLHFHIPNHGKLWKTLMTTYMPDHEERKERLKITV